MANMQAITQKYGPAPTAYFVVPLVGSLFIDFMNTIIMGSTIPIMTMEKSAAMTIITMAAAAATTITIIMRTRCLPAGEWKPLYR